VHGAGYALSWRLARVGRSESRPTLRDPAAQSGHDGFVEVRCMLANEYAVRSATVWHRPFHDLLTPSARFAVTDMIVLAMIAGAFLHR